MKNIYLLCLLLLLTLSLYSCENNRPPKAVATTFEEGLRHANLGNQKIEAMKSLDEIKMKVDVDIEEVKLAMRETPDLKVFLSGQLDTLTSLKTKIDFHINKLMQSTVDTWPVLVEEAVDETVSIMIKMDELTFNRIMQIHSKSE